MKWGLVLTLMCLGSATLGSVVLGADAFGASPLSEPATDSAVRATTSQSLYDTMTSDPYSFGNKLCYKYVYRANHGIPVDSADSVWEDLKKFSGWVYDFQLVESELAWTLLYVEALKAGFVGGETNKIVFKRSKASLMLEQNDEFGRALDECSAKLGRPVSSLTRMKMRQIDQFCSGSDRVLQGFLAAEIFLAFTKLKRVRAAIVKYPKTAASIGVVLTGSAVAGFGEEYYQAKSDVKNQNEQAALVNQQIKRGESPAIALGIEDPDFDMWYFRRQRFVTFMHDVQNVPRGAPLPENIRADFDHLAVFQTDELNRKFSELKSDKNLDSEQKEFLHSLETYFDLRRIYPLPSSAADGK